MCSLSLSISLFCVSLRSTACKSISASVLLMWVCEQAPFPFPFPTGQPANANYISRLPGGRLIRHCADNRQVSLAYAGARYCNDRTFPICGLRVCSIAERSSNAPLPSTPSAPATPNLTQFKQAPPMPRPSHLIGRPVEPTVCSRARRQPKASLGWPLLAAASYLWTPCRQHGVGGPLVLACLT